MSNKTFDELLWLFATGALSGEDQVAFERLLAENPAYRQEAEMMKKLDSVVESIADWRVGALPPLPDSFFAGLDAVGRPSHNGSHSNHPLERENKMINARAIPQYRQENEGQEFKISWTIAAALIAIVILGGLALYMAGSGGDEPEDLVPAAIVNDDDEKQNDFAATVVHVATMTATPIQPTFNSANMSPTDPVPMSVITVTPIPSRTSTFTPTPFGGAPEFGTFPPPTAVPPSSAFSQSPAGSITPSVLAPVISAPARMVEGIQLPGGDGAVDVAWSDDMIAVAGFAGIWLYDPDQLNGAARLLPGGDYGIVDMAFRPERNQLATLGWDGSVRLWDLEIGTQLATLENSEFWVYLAFNNDGTKLISTTRNVEINVGNWLEGLPSVEAITVDSSSEYVVYHPDGERVALFGGQGEIVIQSIATGAELQRFDGGMENVNRFAFNADGDLLALGSVDGMVRVMNVATEEAVDEFAVNGVITGVGFNADSRLLGVISRTQSLQTLWIKNLDTGDQYAAVTFDIALAGFAFSPDGEAVVVATDDGRVLVLDVSGL
jgi:hypothetical protein